MAAYLFLPLFPQWHHSTIPSYATAALCLPAFGVGMFLVGTTVNFLTQRYQRQRVVRRTLLLLVVMGGVLWFFPSLVARWSAVVGLVFGALYGLVQVVLTSVLVIDKTESFLRTEANYLVSSFHRLALALGPIGGIVLSSFVGRTWLWLAFSALCLAAWLLVALVHFPFKAPEESVRLFSTDRFFLRRGLPLFLSFLPFSLAIGLYMGALPASLHLYLLMAAGLFVAVVAEATIFANASLRSEGVAGSILLAMAMLLIAFRNDATSFGTSALLFGLGAGLLAARYLLFFLKLSKHCERGTSHSTFFYAWELGVVFGFAASVYFSPMINLLAGAVLVVMGLAAYHFVVHDWYLQHKSR